MCGIVGYIGAKNATPLLVAALKKLEYRGYDSSGIAVLCGENIIVEKAKGALHFLEEKIAKLTINGNLGIGHTRWATHGEPSDLNAHPHTNMSGSIAVVHNGIIENYLEIKAFLQESGVVFKSQTDSEVIAHLINFFYEKTHDIFIATSEAVKKLSGAYALCVICRDFADRLICARKDCPLVIGIGQGENFVASDVPALLEHTRTVHFLQQNEMATVYADHLDIYNAQGQKIIREPYTVNWDMDAAQKSGYEHFMLKEIYEEPIALQRTLQSHFIYDDTGFVKDIKFDTVDFGSAWQKAHRIVIAACGTAFHAGVVAKYAFEQYARVPVEVSQASEFRYSNPILNADDIFIVISQSGETADTLAALRLAKQRQAKVIAITNCVGSSVSREADCTIYTNAGPEIAVASTKAYMTQLAILYLLALKTSLVRNTIDSDKYKSILQELTALPDKIKEILNNKSQVQKLASRQFNKQKIFFIGRQYDSAVSQESALKLKEVSYMHSEAFSAGELKHGPIALLDDTTLVIAIATQHKLYDKIASNIIEVATRKATTVVITNDTKGVFNKCSDIVLQIPISLDELSPMLSVVVAQLFAYYCSVMRGCDPDKPRNLAKSVTVE